MMRIHEDIYKYPSSSQLRTIAGIDLHEAFDNVTHRAILDNLIDTRLGSKMYNYIAAFLTNRTIQIQIDDYTSPKSTLTAGVPQRAILSPILFNLALKNLPQALATISDLHHNLYADDITIWSNTGSPAEQEQTIQAGLNIIHQYVQAIGLTCSPDKSEYVVVTNGTGEKAETYRDLIHLHIDGKPIPRKHTIKVLGFHIQENGKADVWIGYIIREINQIHNMLRRVTRRSRGLKEHELRKTIEALVYTQVMYHLPYVTLTRTQTKKLETALRKCTRLALGVPRFAPVHLLTDTGLFNSLDDRITIHEHAQHQRLITSQQRRQILAPKQYDTSKLPPLPPPTPPWDSLPRITVLPIPQNMSPDNHQPRREAHARRVLSRTPSDTDVYYTDASHTPTRSRTAVIGSRSSSSREHEGVPSSTAAEILAIAEAITEHTHSTDTILIRTDNQGACRYFRDNDLPFHIHSMLQRHLHAHPHLHINIKWVPGHQGLGGNLRAHTLYRENSNPGPPTLWPEPYDPKEHRKQMHKERTALLLELRQHTTTLHTPSFIFSLSDSTLIRRAQTQTLVTPDYIHFIQGRPGRPVCPHCTGYPSNIHYLGGCPNAHTSRNLLLSPLPSHHLPQTWTEWANPPKTLEATLWPLLVQHVKTMLGDEW
ncbi:uncharacterized protein ISCGN_006022 [Ixodes scapularis]